MTQGDTFGSTVYSHILYMGMTIHMLLHSIKIIGSNRNPAFTGIYIRHLIATYERILRQIRRMRSGHDSSTKRATQVKIMNSILMLCGTMIPMTRQGRSRTGLPVFMERSLLWRVKNRTCTRRLSQKAISSESFFYRHIMLPERNRIHIFPLHKIIKKHTHRGCWALQP